MQQLLTVMALVALAVGLVWLLLYLMAKRLPQGVLRDVRGFLPDCVLLLWRLRHESVVPRSAKSVAVIAVLWALSPIDLIPDFVPGIGSYDDALIVTLALRFVQRRVPRDVLARAWSGDPRVLVMLMGPAPDEGIVPAGARLTGHRR